MGGAYTDQPLALLLSHCKDVGPCEEEHCQEISLCSKYHITVPQPNFRFEAGIIKRRRKKTKGKGKRVGNPNLLFHESFKCVD